MIKEKIESENDYQSIRANNLIDHLRAAISDGTSGLVDVPLLIKQLIESGVWRERKIVQTGETVRFNSFHKFIETLPPEGLGKSTRELEKLCAGDIATLDLLVNAGSDKLGTDDRGRRGGDRRSTAFKVHNVKFEKERKGNSSVYALRRLYRERPDLHQKVLTHELSVNQAMITAGFRRQSVLLSPNIIKTSKTIKKYFTRQQIIQLIKALQKF